MTEFDLTTWLSSWALSEWRWVLDIALVAALFYQVLILLRGSRSGAMLTAVAALFLLYFVSQDDALDLPTIHWLLDKFVASIVILFAILFQEDLKRGLTAMVRSPLVFSSKDAASAEVLEEILRACAVLAQKHLGALIVIEQEATLDRFVADGVRINGEPSWQLLAALFNPEHANATHDGAVILQKGKIAAAACFLPLAGGAGIPGTLGSRHRAALGLADETDAVVVVVSEETGTCGIAYMGQLDLNLQPADLRERFRLLFGDQPEAMAPWRRAWRRRIHVHGGSAVAHRPTIGVVTVQSGVYPAETVTTDAPPEADGVKSPKSDRP